MNSSFEKAFTIVVSHEGGFDETREDPGNWTSGIVGTGRLRGTKYGISAAAYPRLDIAQLTLDQARTIYQRDYWLRIRGDDLPSALALLVFDAAVNSGVRAATRWLQATVGASVDGLFGPVTKRAVAETVQVLGLEAVCIKFLAKRLYFLGCLPNWRLFGRGWSERLCSLMYQSQTLREP